MPRKCLLCGKDNNLRCFPSDPKKSHQWLINIGKEEILNDPKQNDNDISKFKLCTDHFAAWCFTSTEGKRLIKYAEPCKPNISEPSNVAAALAKSSYSVSAVTVTSRTDLLASSKPNDISKFKLRTDHFAASCFTSTEEKRLIKYAEPCKPNISDPGNVAAALAKSSDSVSAVTVTSRTDLLASPKPNDISKFKLCTDHFAASCFTSTKEKRLIKYAEPCKPNISDPGNVAAALAKSSDSVSAITITSRTDLLASSKPKFESQTSSLRNSKCTLLKIIPKAQKLKVLKITDKELKRCLFDKSFLKQLQKMLTPNQYQVILSHVRKSGGLKEICSGQQKIRPLH